MVIGVSPSPFAYPAYAEISNNKIFALHFTDFAYWGTQEFGYYDMAEQKYVKLISSDDSVDQFRVHQNKLVVLDAKGQLKNYLITDKSIKENEEVVFDHSGYENMRYTYSGKLIFNYLNETGDNNKLVIVQ